MKIAFVCADATPLARTDAEESDDRGRRLVALARALAAAGHTVDVFTRRNDLWSAPVVALAPNANLVQLPAGPPHFVPAAQVAAHVHDFAARFVGACGSADRCDVVHASFHLSGIAALRLRERHGVPFVISFREHALPRTGSGVAGSAGLAAAPGDERRLATAADCIVAFDPAERDRLLAGRGPVSTRIEVVPAGIDTTAFAPASKAVRVRFGLRPEEFVVIQRTRLERRAGIDTAIRAIAALKRDHRIAARLLVAAEANDFDPYVAAEVARLRAIAAAAGVASQLTFTGAGPPASLRDAYAAADVAIVMATDDGCSASPLEAMACGLPVVGADVDAVRWVIQNEVTGFLVPAGDPPALGERLARFRRNPELGRAYGRAGIRRVRAGHTWRHTAAGLARVYASVLAPHRSRLATAASR